MFESSGNAVAVSVHAVVVMLYTCVVTEDLPPLLQQPRPGSALQSHPYPPGGTIRV